MSGIAEKKKELRRHYLDVRQNLSEEEVNSKSKSIVDQVLNLSSFQEATNIHSYVSIKKNKEVQTSHLIKHCFLSDRRVAVPKMLGRGKLQHIEINSLAELQENSWGVPEPKEGKAVSEYAFDVIIVPMVAGDHFKNRLGYGKGYYDRFLDKSSATTIGLLFDCQLRERKLPVEEFDIPLDILVTESQQIK